MSEKKPGPQFVGRTVVVQGIAYRRAHIFACPCEGCKHRRQAEVCVPDSDFDAFLSEQGW